MQAFKLIDGLDGLDWKDVFTKSRIYKTTLSQCDLFIAYYRTTTRKFAYRNRAAPMWNKLSETTRSVDTLNKFKNMPDKDPYFRQYSLRMNTMHNSCRKLAGNNIVIKNNHARYLSLYN